MQLGLPESSSEYAEEGTAMHEVGAECLETGVDASTLVGQVFNGRFALTTEDAETLQTGYINPVRSLGGQLMVEQRLSISHITGEEDAYGTSDTVILLGDEIIIADLKFGMGVKVDAQDNKQLAMYALAALEEFSILGDFKTVRMMIFQPRLYHTSEWVITVEELLAIGEQLKLDAAKATRLINFARAGVGLQATHSGAFTPSEDNCRWCKVSGNCGPQEDFILATLGADFDNLEASVSTAIESVKHTDESRLAVLMPSLGLIESWCKAVMARGESIIHGGGRIVGYKLVQGKRGNRAWTDKDEAEKAMKSMRLKLDEMYTMSVIGPVPAETLLAKKSPRKWKKLSALITQKDGQPTVVAESDKRPAIVVAAPESDFDDVTDDASDLV